MSRFPVEHREDWFGSQRYFQTLDDCVEQRVNAVILGPQGSGKTSLLRTMFSRDYCERLARERKLLVCEANLADRQDGEAICHYLAGQIAEKANRYLQESERTNVLFRELRGVNDEPGQQRLSRLITQLYREYGYFVVLFMDHFERFTTSPRVTMEHHEVLRSLIENDMLRCIVATNYDLSQDSLQPNMPGSYLLQKFTKPILLAPLSEEDSAALLQRHQEQADWKMPEKLMEVLYSLSGGIPWVLEAAAEQVYDNRENNGGGLDIPKAKEAIYKACLPIFKSWCKYLTSFQARTLRMLAERVTESGQYAVRDFTMEQSDLLNAAVSLKSRGLLRQTEYMTKSGRMRPGPDHELRFNCLLFQRFCQEGLADQVVQENPFEKIRLEAARREQQEKEIAWHEARMRQLEEEEKQAQIKRAQQAQTRNTYVHIDHVDNMQVVQGITPGQLLELLGTAGESKQGLAERLSHVLRQGLSIPALPELPQGVGEAALAQQLDELWDQAGRRVIQDVRVDEEQDLIDVTPAALQNLDIRFRDARDRCRTELTDAILEEQSERCQFYLKLSVVVEDALKFPGVQMEDYSPQLVFYGKALEQALRDNLYELFHWDQELSIYNPMTRVDAPNSGEVFRNKPVGKTYVGNYEYLIAGKKERLEGLCQTYPVHTVGMVPPDSWADWWGQLQHDIGRARVIRNLMGHAGEQSPTQEKLDQMCGLLMGSPAAPGILERMTVGKQLTLMLVPREIPQQAVEQLVGTVCDMECTARKNNGGLRGITCEGGYTVNISPRMVQKYRVDTDAQGDALVGKIFSVRLLEYKVQDQREFFSGALVAERT